MIFGRSGKVGYPNAFFQEIRSSGGKQTIHKVSAAFIVKNSHPRASFKSGIISVLVLSKLSFPERLLFHYLIINIRYNEQKSIFYRSILA